MTEESKVNPFEIFEIDSERENTIGIWAEYPVKGQPNRGFRIRIVHSGDTNIAYRDALRARLKPLNYRIQQDMLSDEEFEGIVQKVFADKIIKEWQSKDENGKFVDGIYGENFNILPVTKENVISTFEKAPRLFKDLKKQADNFATFKIEEVKADSKN